MNDSRICIALDFQTKQDVKDFLDKLKMKNCMSKLGWNYFMVKVLK